MLRGRFGNTSGRPYLEGRLIIPRLAITADISFLVDTGADRSLLMPLDSERLGIDTSELDGDLESTGIGGAIHNFVERAVLVLSEPKVAIHLYYLDLCISPPDPGIQDIPSLLGRDVLDRLRMTYDAQRPSLTFRVLSADLTLPITKP
jgi:hypothetical protein